MIYQQRIKALISNDVWRMKALRAVNTLNLPDCFIAAGFVRNAIWDDMFDCQTPMNDIDVVFYCESNTSENRDLLLEHRLRILEPELPWSVKNQARMHLKNGDTQYQNTLDAMGFWPEKQTAIGVALNDDDNIELIHCFDLSLQFSGTIDHNPKRAATIFKSRIDSKHWLDAWPSLNVNIER